MSNKYSFWGIIFTSFNFFVKNFKNLFFVMLPPILMQMLGLVLSLFPVIYLVNIKKLSSELLFPYIIPILICTIIGLLLYCSGFWKYLLTGCYFSLAADDFDSNKGFYIQIYKSNIDKRQGDYAKTLLWPALFMFLIFVFGMVAITYFISVKTPLSILVGVLCMILLTVILVIFSLKIALLVPIFSLEPKLCPLDVMKKSFEMTKMPKMLLVVGISFIVCFLSITLQVIFSVLGAFIASDTIVLRFIDLITSCIILLLLPINICAMTLLYKRFLQ